jgi:hypothetical protein
MNNIQNVASAAVLLFMFATALPAPAEISCWVIDGKHSVYGTAHICASVKGVKIDNESSGRLLIAQPPDWKVAVFDKDTHKYFVESAEAFAKQKLTRVVSMAVDIQKAKPERTNIHEIVGGVATTVYVCQAEGIDTGRKVAIREMPIKLWVSDKLGLPQATYDALSRCAGMPKLPGIVLRFRFEGKNLIETTAVKKQSLPDNLFQYPPGYTAAKSLQEVMFSIDTIRDMVGP